MVAHLKFSRMSSGRWSSKSLTVNCACLEAPVTLSNLTSGSSSDESSESSTTGLVGGMTVLSSCNEILRMCWIPGLVRLRRPAQMTSQYQLSGDRSQTEREFAKALLCRLIVERSICFIIDMTSQRATHH